MTTTVKVVDAPMGAGKTSWAVQHMNESPGKKFIFITPYEDEVSRVVEGCSEREFKTPLAEDTGLKGKSGRPRKSKLVGLKKLLRAGENIASTHSLFKKFDLEVLELIKEQGYVLIMDEVTDCIDRPRLATELEEAEGSQDDDDDADKEHSLRVEGLLEADIIREDQNDTRNGKYVKVIPGENVKLGYNHIQRMAAEGRLVLIKSQAGMSLLMWLFPSQIFESFTEVYCLCYMFRGQIQAAYYHLNDIQVEMLSVIHQDKRYDIIPYDPTIEAEFVEKARGLLKIHKGRQNDVGTKTGPGYPLCSKWYTKFREAAEKLMETTRDWFRKNAGVNSEGALWCAPEWVKTGTKWKRGWKKGISPRSFQGCWISTETRATNKFRHKTAIAFLYSVFFKQSIERYLKAAGLREAVNEDIYALSRMVQVLWRGCIRDGKPMSVFVPSARMRGLLEYWIGGNSFGHEDVETQKLNPEDPAFPSLSAF